MEFLFDFSFSAITDIVLIKVLVTTYSAILFLQSGLDKASDWSGNMSYFKSVFSKSFLRNAAPLLLPVITILELAAGVCSALGAVMMMAGMSDMLAKTGLFTGAFSILCLFGGLRIAKDYGAAAAITTYFIFFVVALGIVMGL